VKFLRRFFIRLSNLATRRSVDQRLQEEIAEHLAFQTEENLRVGMSPAEARRQAALKLGAAEAIRERHHAEQSLPLIENMLFDLRYSVRMLLRSPGFSFIAIATMALGIGVTTAIYSVIDATLLHPLPFPNPSELVRIQDDLPGVGAQGVGMSVPEWTDLESSGIFQSAAITGTGANVNLIGSAQPLRLSFKQVTPNYFSVLGVDAQLGRTFNANDTTPGYNLEVVLSDGSGGGNSEPTRTFSAKQCAWTTTCITSWVSCRAGFAIRGPPATSRMWSCGWAPALPVCRFRPRSAIHVCAVVWLSRA